MQVRKKYKDIFKEITERLRAMHFPKPGERPQSQAAQYSLLISVLESAVDFNPQIPEADRPSVLRSAVSYAAKEANLTHEVLEKHLVDFERDYLRAPIIDFVLATAIGMRGYYGRKTISINGVRISFASTIPKRFDRTAIADRVEKSIWNMPPHILQVLVRVSARTPTAAFNQAQASLDLMRALWNLIINSGSYQTLMDAPKPVNLVLPGSVHTLHLLDGTLIEDFFWIGVQPLRYGWVYVADKQWPAIEKQALRLRSVLRSINYNEDIEKALVRYVRALDDADSHSSFTRVWGVLEYLVNTVGDYDTLIRRICFLASDNDRNLTRMLIEHLRDVRNAIIHGDEERTNMATYLDQVRFVTEKLIQFHLDKRNPFKSRAAAAEYLDAPTDRRLLQERVCNYRRALRRK